MRRAFYVEIPTGHSQWETPMQDSQFASRGGPPPESDSYYRGGPPPPGYGPPGGPEGYGPPPPDGEYENPEEKKKGGKGKYFAAGAAGLALGAAGGAFLGHKMSESPSPLSPLNLFLKCSVLICLKQPKPTPPTKKEKKKKKKKNAKSARKNSSGNLDTSAKRELANARRERRGKMMNRLTRITVVMTITIGGVVMVMNIRRLLTGDFVRCFSMQGLVVI